MRKPIKDDGGPAFPTDHATDTTFTDIRGGLTVRQWYAGRALQGLVTNGKVPVSKIEVAQCAFEYADAMILFEEAEGRKHG